MGTNYILLLFSTIISTRVDEVVLEDILYDISYLDYTQLQSGTLRFIISDVNHAFKNVSISGSFMCTFDLFCSHIAFSENGFHYDFSSKEWIYEYSKADFKNCSDATFNYFVLAYVNKPDEVILSVLLGSENRIYNPLTKKFDRKRVLPNQKLNNFLNEILNYVKPSDLSDPTLNFIINKQECKYSKTVINKDQKVCEGDLIFEDNFDTLNLDKWSYDVKIPLDTEDADFVSFQNLRESLYIKDGHLNILPKLLTEVSDFNEKDIRNGQLNLGLNCTGIFDRQLECKRNASTFRILPPIVTARIRTKDKFSFKYGVVEIKAKLPIGDWLFPQLFLEPDTNHYGISSYLSGQIRIAFARGNKNLKSSKDRDLGGNRLYGGVVLACNEEFREMWMKNYLQAQSHFGSDYNLYRTIWTEEYISFWLNDIEYGRLNGNFAYEAFDTNEIQHAEYWKTGSKMAPFDKEFFVSLGVSAGGMSDFPDKVNSYPFPKPWRNLGVKSELNFWKAKDKWHSTWDGENAALKIDYIRVWAY